MEEELRRGPAKGSWICSLVPDDGDLPAALSARYFARMGFVLLRVSYSVLLVFDRERSAFWSSGLEA